MKDNTEKLLRKCGLGAQMGVNGINAAQRYATDPELLNLLSEFKDKHRKVEEEADLLLAARGKKGKHVNKAVKKMARAVTSVRIAVRPENSRIAEMMIRSCDSALERLAGLLSKYAQAEEPAKECVKKLVLIEQEYRIRLKNCAYILHIRRLYAIIKVIIAQGGK